jgi:hypothetical protein
MGKRRRGASGGARWSQAEADEIDVLEARIQELQDTAEVHESSNGAGVAYTLHAFSEEWPVQI